MKIEAKILNNELWGYNEPFLRGSDDSAGLDLRALLGNLSPLTIFPKQTVKIRTGLSIWIKDPGYAGFIMARSGIASKKGLAPANKVGLIDSDYQGELIVALHNHSMRQQEVEDGERIAQLIIVPVAPFRLDIVSEFSNRTERGAGGFGSTGAH